MAEVTSLGLVQMTRKRIGSGLLESFSVPCEHCAGRGLKVSMTPVDHEHPESPRYRRPANAVDPADVAARALAAAELQAEDSDGLVEAMPAMTDGSPDRDAAGDAGATGDLDADEDAAAGLAFDVEGIDVEGIDVGVDSEDTDEEDSDEEDSDEEDSDEDEDDVDAEEDEGPGPRRWAASEELVDEEAPLDDLDTDEEAPLDAEDPESEAPLVKPWPPEPEAV